jgi:hypothetical protein
MQLSRGVYPCFAGVPEWQARMVGFSNDHEMESAPRFSGVIF